MSPSTNRTPTTMPATMRFSTTPETAFSSVPAEWSRRPSCTSLTSSTTMPEYSVDAMIWNRSATKIRTVAIEKRTPATSACSTKTTAATPSSTTAWSP
jgi:hypothetical protein